jgi:hypothetical protein
MSAFEIAFLTLVVAAFGTFGVTLASVAWYCRDRTVRTPAVARARQSSPAPSQYLETGR